MSLFDQTDLLLPVLLGGVLVVGGLLVYGFGDLRRWSGRRMLAVAGLTFREGVRRRILWVVPLAMIATVLLMFLADPKDERQAMSQAIRAALFASGLVAVLVPLILGSVTFPREMQSRVIFSVVTKPITRLELIVGKIVGLSGLAAAVLVAMGIFTYVAMVTLDARLRGGIEARLQTALDDDTRRPYLDFVADAGLLPLDGAMRAVDLQVYAQPPVPGEEAIRFFPPNDYYAAVPYELDPEAAQPLLDGAMAGELSMRVLIRLDWELLPSRLPPGSLPIGVQNPDNLPELRLPVAQVSLRTQTYQRYVAIDLIPNNSTLLPRAGLDADWSEAGVIAFGPEVAAAFLSRAGSGGVQLCIWGGTDAYMYGINDESVKIEVLDAEGSVLRTLEPQTSSDGPAIQLRTRFGRGGLGLRTDDEPGSPPPPYGVFAFRDVDLSGDADFIVLGDVEVSGDGLMVDDSRTGLIEVRGVSIDGTTSEWQAVHIDTARPGYFSMPADVVEAGDFDVQVRSLSDGQIITLSAQNLRISGAGGSFLRSLVPALLGQWLLALLAATLAVSFGTLVNWPVALVLTVSVLGGRWVVEQAGTDYSGRDAASYIVSDEETSAAATVAARQVVERGFDALTLATQSVANFLPDVSQVDFAPMTSRRQVVPWLDLAKGLGLTMCYVLPVLAAGYVLLRRREVAA